MLRLNPDPTFTAPVDVPIPGQEKPVRVKVVFAYKDKDALAAFLAAEEANPRPAIDWLMDIVKGWTEGVEGEFSRENLGVLLSKYDGLERVIGRAYYSELAKARLGN